VVTTTRGNLCGMVVLLRPSGGELCCTTMIHNALFGRKVSLFLLLLTHFSCCCSHSCKICRPLPLQQQRRRLQG